MQEFDCPKLVIGIAGGFVHNVPFFLLMTWYSTDMGGFLLLQTVVRILPVTRVTSLPYHDSFHSVVTGLDSCDWLISGKSWIWNPGLVWLGRHWRKERGVGGSVNDLRSCDRMFIFTKFLLEFSGRSFFQSVF